MRLFIALSMFVLVGCAQGPATPADPMGAPGSPMGAPVETPQGGGGGSLDPLQNCPVDFVDQLRLEIAAVPVRMYRTILESQWSVIDARANSSGPDEMAHAVGGFISLVDYFERRNEISTEQATRMRLLVRCYQ